MRNSIGSIASKRLARILGAGTLAAMVWLAARYSWPSLAAAISFVLLVALSTLIGEKVPIVLERVSGADRIQVAVGADVGFYSDGWSVVLPHDVDASNTPPQGLEHLQARSYLSRAGAFDLRETRLLLTLVGGSIDPVRITGLRSRVITRQPPLSGAVVSSASAGEQLIVGAHFDLDENEAPARGDEGHEYFRDYILTLARGESFVYRIIARVRRSTCEWQLILNYSHRGAEHELVIDNGGDLFRTAARSEEVAGIYEWAWYEQPAKLIEMAT